MREPVHGRLSTYTNRKCRCDACTEAARSYTKELRAKKKEQAKALVDHYMASKAAS